MTIDSDQVEIELYRLKNWPWWVRQYLRMTYSRQAAITFSWLSAIGSVVFGIASVWHNAAALFALVCLQGSIFIYLAARWVDRNSNWHPRK